MMSREIHRLKTIEPFFSDIEKGSKSFEIRKDDRVPKFKVGDLLCLDQYVNGVLTGRAIFKEIQYILRDAPEFGLKEGFCIIGLI
jgi:hypothetical protein